MNFGPKRGHFVYVFDDFFKSFGMLLVVFVLGLITGNFSQLMGNTFVVVIVLIGPVLRVVRWAFTFFSIDDEKLIIRSGWIGEKKLEVPLSTITTVDFSQSIIHRMFGVYRLNIDNASNISDTETKISMIFSEADAKEVKHLLEGRKTGIDGFNIESKGEETPRAVGNNLRVPVKNIILMGALSSKMVFLFELIAALGAVGQLVLSNGILNEDIFTKGLDFAKMTVGIPAGAIAVFIAVFILSIICGAIGSFVRYFGFHVLDDGMSLHIEYGLLTKKHYAIQKNKISGFYFNQSLFARFFKVGTLKMFAIGYGGESDESVSEDPIVNPLIREERLFAVMAMVSDEFSEQAVYEKAQPKAFHYFFYSVPFLVLLLLAIAVLVWGETTAYAQFARIFSAVLVLLGIGNVVLNYFNAGLDVKEKYIAVSGGGYTRHRAFIKLKHVESVKKTGSIWKTKKGLATVEIGFLGPLALANQVVRNISVAAFDRIKSSIIY